MDKGYYSGANRKYLQSLEGLKEFCLQQPGAPGVIDGKFTGGTSVSLL
jgi:hypothetical protein